jgi:hypothetical protein
VARKRPAASDVVPPDLTLLDGGALFDGGLPRLTRAEAYALRRSAPLTTQQLRKHLRGVPDPPLRGV